LPPTPYAHIVLLDLVCACGRGPATAGCHHVAGTQVPCLRDTRTGTNQKMALIRRDPPGLAPPPFEQFYHSSVRTVGGTRLLFCAGQVGSASGGVDDTMGATAADQLPLCYENIGKILAEAGMGWGDVVKRTTWLTESCSFADYRAASLAAMGDALPASAGLGIDMGPGVLCEIEIIAAKQAPGPEAVLKWNPADVVPHPAYWHVATVPSDCRLLFAAGQVGKRADGSVPADPAEQCAQAYDNMSTILSGAGMGWGDVIKRTTYRTPGWEREWELPVVAASMGEDRSCHTGIGVDFLATPEFRIEVDMVSAKPVRKPIFLSTVPYVCPEPVLVKH
jgi:2-iminobutanoate/2-iminopropanoate deaminase